MTAVTIQTLFNNACRGQVFEKIPVWLMRQAGRYLPAYQKLKHQASFWDLCSKPDLAAKATLSAVEYLDADAAIIFSDITVIGKAMGLPLHFDPGPKFLKVVRDEQELKQLKTIKPEQDLEYVLEAIDITRAQLDKSISLIGFCGAPFSLAAYMIEGIPNKNWLETKKIIYNEPQLAIKIIDRVTDAIIAHAQAQVKAGCDVIQLFDSNAGELAFDDLEKFALAPARRAIKAIKLTGVPVIYFARNISAQLKQVATVKADVLSIDWQISIATARQKLRSMPLALQGNLDPITLFCSRSEIERRAHAILQQAHGHPGFIFNLGHGVLPLTPPENARHLIEIVHSWRPDK
ncbi:MAG: uroporphyrinogen decarboxylase [Deltaproteobacteria bacterium]|nr:uroporphyrinogen decarboxylase [Deltaproteobacteria bacterium]